MQYCLYYSVVIYQKIEIITIGMHVIQQPTPITNTTSIQNEPSKKTSVDNSAYVFLNDYCKYIA